MKVFLASFLLVIIGLRRKYNIFYARIGYCVFLTNLELQNPNSIEKHHFKSHPVHFAKTASQHKYLITIFLGSILITFLVRKRPFSKDIFHMFIWGSARLGEHSFRGALI